MSEHDEIAKAPLVLLVDDQPSNLAILRRLVESTGYRTCQAENGELAIQLLETLQPDAMLLDIFMPVLDGFGVLQAVRRHPTLSYTPIIIVTAAAELNVRQQAYNEGADDFLLKPVDAATLRARLRVAIRLKQVLSRMDKERERLAFIANISRELTHINSLNGMLDHMVHVCSSALHAEHGNLILLDTASTVSDVLANANSQINLQDVRRVLTEGAAGHAIRSGASVRIDDVVNDPRWLHIPTSEIQSGSALLVPIDDADGPLGVLSMYHPSLWYFTPDDQALLELVAYQVAGLIRQARLREEQVTLTDQLSLQTRQLQLVNTLAQSLTSNLDLSTLYQVIDQQMQQLMGKIAVGWYALDEASTILAYSSRPQPNVNKAVDAITHQAMVQIAQLDRSTRFSLHDAPQIPMITTLLESGYEGCIAIPLHQQGRLLGILMIGAYGRLFTSDEESLLEMARPHLAVALANAQAVADQSARHIEQAELRHLRNMAELAGQMAHHFNNLFAAILGNTQLAELDAVSEDQQMLLATVVDQVRDGAAMIRRLHLLKGGERVAPPFSLDVEETLPSLLEHIAQSTGLPLVQTDIAPNLQIAVHERELLTLFGELLANAYESGGDPDAVVLQARQASHHVSITITDAGKGVAEHLATDIWRPFLTTHGPQRLGLGLPICAAVMWRIGGIITLTPNIDRPGMTATLLFPQVAGGH
jgi:CheY-like chemotaxis protein/GAF domain-containing protein